MNSCTFLRTNSPRVRGKERPFCALSYVFESIISVHILPDITIKVHSEAFQLLLPTSFLFSISSSLSPSWLNLRLSVIYF